MKEISDPFLKGGGGVYGTALGRQLGEGITKLANMKMEHIKQQKNMGIYQNLGINPEISKLPQDVQDKIVQEHVKQYGAGPSQGNVGGSQSAGGKTGLLGQLGARRYPPAQQKAINTMNAPWLKDNEKAYGNARAALQELDYMEELLNTGKVSSGGMGKITPGFLQNTETQQFDKSSNTLAGLLAGAQGGVPTGLRIKFAQSQKPNLEQDPKTQRALIQKLRAEAERAVMRNEIKDRIIEENGGEQPSNMATLVNRAMKMYDHNPNFMVGEDQQQQPEQQQQQGQGQPYYWPGQNPGPQNNQQGPNLPPQNNQEYDTSNEGLVDWAARNAAGGLKSVGSAAVGGLGDIVGAGLGIGNYLTKGAIPNYSEAKEKIPYIGKFLPPTSQQISEKIDEWSGGYTKPQSGAANLYQDVLGTFGSIVGPAKVLGQANKWLPKLGVSANTIAKTGKVALPFSGTEVSVKGALARSLAGEAGARIAEAGGGGPLPQAIAKAAFMMAAGTAGSRKAIKEAATKDFDDAATKIGTKKVSVEHDIRRLTKLERKLVREGVPHQDDVFKLIKESKDGMLASKKEKTVTEVINKLSGKVKKHKVTTYEMPVNEVIQMYKNNNAKYSWTKPENFVGQKGRLPKEVELPLGQLLSEINHPIARGLKDNTEAAGLYLRARDSWKGLHTSSQATKNMREWSDVIGDQWYKGLYKAGAGIIFKIPLEISRLTDLFNYHPTAGRYYLDTVLAAARGDKQAFIKHLAKFDHVAQHFTSKEEKKKK